MSSPDAMAGQGRETKANLPRLSEKYFYLLMSLLITAVVVYGFSQTVEKKLIRAAPPRPFVLYIHGALFFGWVLFFILQSGLVRTQKVQWHQRIGWFGVGLGLAMFVVGVSTAITMARFNKVELHAKYPEANLLVSFFDISAFTIAFALAVLWRKKPEFHRRLQLLACCALTAAAFGRFLPLYLSPGRIHSRTVFAFAAWVTLYAGVDLLILLAIGLDWVVMRRVHRVYMYGLPSFVICQALVIYTIFHHSTWWMKTAEAVLG
jgi:hypothetical protein